MGMPMGLETAPQVLRGAVPGLFFSASGWNSGTIFQRRNAIMPFQLRPYFPPVFSTPALENEPDALNCRAKALALAVRQYDTTGRGVFVFSTSETGTSWVKPDLAVVEWPEGEWEGNALVFDKSALQRRRMIGAPMMGIRSVCVARMPGGEDGRREFFRTLATSRWAQCGELVIVGELPDDSECAALRGLAAEFGVGVLCLEIADERLGELPGAEEIFKAGDEECAALLAELTPVRLAAGRLKTLEADTGETLGGEFGALFDWLAACLERGSVEEYEFRVSCY